MHNISFNNFYDLIESMTSDMEVDILKAQGINNVLSFLRAKDLYSIFKIDCKELDDLKKRACIQLKNGEYMIRPAIQENLDYCIRFFKNELPEQQAPRQSDFEHNQQNFNTKQENFMNTFIGNLTDNINRSKYNYQYNSQVRRFAASVYGLGGRNLYEFLRLNLPGGFPSIPTLESYSNEFCTRIEEGEFRFEELKNYLNKIHCKFVYGSEDSTNIIRKIQYDTETNSFIGFCVSLLNGLPSTRQYQTDNFSELEDWFEQVNQATLVNIHMVQPIANVPSPTFLLTGFGTDNTYDAISIIGRWLHIYEQSYKNKIRVVGFSSDADTKFLKAMRLVIGYFARLSNINLLDRDDVFYLKIPKSWSSWFFLRPQQLFLCLQDSTHIATKLRNRLLSKSVSLLMGSYRASALDLQDLIQNGSKFEHGLVLSDLYVKDKQNYSSCLKISSPNVLNILNQRKETGATHCYLSILNSITIAYIDKTTNVLTRLFHAWFTVFISRFWWVWIRYKSASATGSKSRKSRRPSSKTIGQHFMSFPAFYSIEINASCFTYIILLILNKTLPVEASNIFLFSSQPCENMFRSTRSSTGPFSSVNTFTLPQFFAKTRKISILNEIKSSEEFNIDSNTIKFPKHHKHNKDDSLPSPSIDFNDITLNKIEKCIYDAFEAAKSFTEKLEMASLLKENNVFELNNLCTRLHDDLEDMIFINDNSTLEVNDDSDDDDSNQENVENDTDSEDECIDAENACTTAKKQSYNGMRIYSSVADEDKYKFFKINVNGIDKFLHKQTAAWLLTKKNTRLSSDRLIRVEQTSKQ